MLPFYNQSDDATVHGEKVAKAYFEELQQIPGFEVMPVGVAKQLMMANNGNPQSGKDFQMLARQWGVDAVVVGAITDYSPYYPPKIGLAINWYAANPCFHPIPAGYGLPWGTPAEEDIPRDLQQAAEFALAREQLKTQTPEPDRAPAELLPGQPPRALPNQEETGDTQASYTFPGSPANETLPPDWPDPRGFIPTEPQPHRPACIPQTEPIITHTRLYDGHDSDFTERLANYFYFRDDARFGGWQAYLQRSDDFIRFCCHLHLAETLTARGGAGETEVVWRWPIRRYER